MGKVGLSDLLRGIEKVMKAEEALQLLPTFSTQTSTASPLMRRVKYFANK